MGTCFLAKTVSAVAGAVDSEVVAGAGVGVVSGVVAAGEAAPATVAVAATGAVSDLVSAAEEQPLICKQRMAAHSAPAQDLKDIDNMKRVKKPESAFPSLGTCVQCSKLLKKERPKCVLGLISENEPQNALRS